MNSANGSREGDEFNVTWPTIAQWSHDPVIESIKRMAIDSQLARERRDAAAVLLRAVSHLQRRGPSNDPRILGLTKLREIRSLVERLPLLGGAMYADTLTAIHDLLYAGHLLQPQRDVLSRLEALANALLEVEA